MNHFRIKRFENKDIFVVESVFQANSRGIT